MHVQFLKTICSLHCVVPPFTASLQRLSFSKSLQLPYRCCYLRDFFPLFLFCVCILVYSILNSKELATGIYHFGFPKQRANNGEIYYMVCIDKPPLNSFVNLSRENRSINSRSSLETKTGCKFLFGACFR